VSDNFEVQVSAGVLRAHGDGTIAMPHRWTEEGVTVSTEFTGAHLLHLSVAACVLNDIYREAASAGVAVDGVSVIARGGFDTQRWTSHGISYSVQVESPATASEVDALLATVDEVAEIPRTLRAQTGVWRVH
jgi:hypothetical protein